MKTILTAALAAALFATSAPSAAADESVCLTLAVLAEAYGEAREIGRTEKDLLATIGNPKLRGISTMLINLVFTLELNGPQARKLVYLKCLNGSLNPHTK